MLSSCPNNPLSKRLSFLDNAGLLWNIWRITPVMYGSLGLEYLTGENLHADDIDILIPRVYLAERWSEFRAGLERNGYVLTDEAEHTFVKDGIHYSYAQVEELAAFAGIDLSQIATIETEAASFRLLSLEQYLKVYITSAKDGYRIEVRGKKDAEKIALIQKRLEMSRVQP